MRPRPPFALAALSLALAAGASAAPQFDDVRLNQVQVIGSHNSYHVQPVPELITIYAALEPDAIFWEYTHRPLDEQFELLGIRQIELDVVVDDPAGGRYADPFGLTLLTGVDPHLPEHDVPGLKVIHVPDLDFVSTCTLFTECLTILRDWSDANPTHLPIMVLVELKDTDSFIVEPLPFDAAAMDAVDDEIRSVFPDEQLITPDDVRGKRKTLPEAIAEDGWPTLRESRGKVLFALDNGGEKRDLYVAGHPALKGRVLFTDSPPGSPEAAFAKRNDPIGGFDEIGELVEQGFIVRTRADADTVEARSGDTTMRDAALASGAQYVSTDYRELGPFGTDYMVELPGGAVARCNAISGGERCADELLDEGFLGSLGIAGKLLRIADRAGVPAARRITVSGDDPWLQTPLPGTANDPILAGGVLTLSNATTAESAAFTLPAGAAWKTIGKPAAAKGFVYRDPAGANGPCTLVSISNGGKLTAKCSGKKGDIPFTLDEASQGALDVTFQFGTGRTHCMRFGGTVSRDTSVGAAPSALFLAKNAPAAGCPE